MLSQFDQEEVEADPMQPGQVDHRHWPYALRRTLISANQPHHPDHTNTNRLDERRTHPDLLGSTPRNRLLAARRDSSNFRHPVEFGPAVNLSFVSPRA